MYANLRNFRDILDRKWKYGRFAYAQWKIRNITLIYGRIAKIPELKSNRCRGTRWWRQISDRKWKYGRFAHAQWKIRNIMLIYGRTAEIPASSRKSGSRNTMVTSDFRLEVKIRPFRACAMKNMQYNAYLWPNRRNSRVLKEIGVEEHDRGQILDRKWKCSPLIHALCIRP